MSPPGVAPADGLALEEPPYFPELLRKLHGAAETAETAETAATAETAGSGGSGEGGLQPVGLWLHLVGLGGAAAVAEIKAAKEAHPELAVRQCLFSCAPTRPAFAERHSAFACGPPPQVELVPHGAVAGTESRREERVRVYQGADGSVVAVVRG